MLGNGLIWDELGWEMGWVGWDELGWEMDWEMGWDGMNWVGKWVGMG